MAKDRIINLRVKDAELEAIDLRAEQEGLSRSNLIRKAINLILAQPLDIVDRKLDEPQTTVVPTTSGPQCPYGGPRGCSAAIWIRGQDRKRICQTCGVKN